MVGGGGGGRDGEARAVGEVRVVHRPGRSFRVLPSVAEETRRRHALDAVLRLLRGSPRLLKVNVVPGELPLGAARLELHAVHHRRRLVVPSPRGGRRGQAGGLAVPEKGRAVGRGRGRSVSRGSNGRGSRVGLDSQAPRGGGILKSQRTRPAREGKDGGEAPRVRGRSLTFRAIRPCRDRGGWATVDRGPPPSGCTCPGPCCPPPAGWPYRSCARRCGSRKPSCADVSQRSSTSYVSAPLQISPFEASRGKRSRDGSNARAERRTDARERMSISRFFPLLSLLGDRTGCDLLDCWSDDWNNKMTGPRD